MLLTKENILRNVSNIPGKSIKEKIIVIESDDWGSIRMPSLQTYENLKSKGIQLDIGDAKRYSNFDTLASSDDLNALFDTLSSVKNAMNQSPKLTAISLSANPDFDKIRDNKFQSYFFEPFTITLEKYGKASAIEFWKEGIKSNLFYPQFHGREHLNVATWMRALQNNDPETKLVFEYGLWAFKHKLNHKVSYQAAFDLEVYEDLALQKEIVTSGLKLFEKIHGFKATFFVPPNGPFNNALEENAALEGVKFMSTSKIQKEVYGEGKVKTRWHYIGQKNKQQQIYITRNCFFEPSNPNKDWVISCMNDIEIAFNWNKPAVISSHRVNYIGGLKEENRKNGLQQLKKLLDEIVKRWPDVNFMFSHELGENLI